MFLWRDPPVNAAQVACEENAKPNSSREKQICFVRAKSYII